MIRRDFMKKSGLKITALVVALLFVITVFTACGSAAADKSADTSGTVAVSAGSPTDAAKTAQLDPVKLRFFFMNDKKAAADEVWTAIGEKFKDQLNAAFEVNFIPSGDYISKLMVMSSSGDNWDANYDGGWMAYNQMVQKGGYLPVNDLLPKYAPTLNTNLQAAGTLKAVTVDGKIMAVPWSMKGNEHPYLVWRSDLLKKAGLDYAKDSIKTEEEFNSFLDALYKAMPDMKFVIPDNNSFPGGNFNLQLLRDEYFDLKFHGLVIGMNDAQCNIVGMETLPLFKQSLQLRKKQYDSGLIAKDAMVDKTEASQYWKNGMIPYTVTSHEWAYANASFSDPAATIESSELYPDKKYYNRSPTGNLMAINKNAANPERAMMFLELMETSQDLYDMVMYGIKDKTYVLNGQNADFPAGMTGATSNYMEWGGQWSMWKPQFMRPTAQYSEGFWKREAEFASTPNHIPSPIDGLSFNTETIKNELAQRDQIMTEMGKPLAAGIATGGNFDKAVDDMIGKLKAAGYDKITAELNKQVQAYLASLK
jgi:putative aldouronate transport system substrate-binding protein